MIPLPHGLLAIPKSVFLGRKGGGEILTGAGHRQPGQTATLTDDEAMLLREEGRQPLQACWIRLAAVLVTLAAAACTTAPVAEVRAFRKSTQAVDAAATPILDDLAVAERRV